MPVWKWLRISTGSNTERLVRCSALVSCAFLTNLAGELCEMLRQILGFISDTQLAELALSLGPDIVPRNEY